MPGFHQTMVLADVTSGEGIITKLSRLEPDRVVGDTRAIAWAEEFSAVLRAKSREVSTIGPILRRAYNGDLLERNTVKPAPGVESPAMSMIAHVTQRSSWPRQRSSTRRAGSSTGSWSLPLKAVEVSNPLSLDISVYAELAERLSQAVGVARCYRNPVLVTPEASTLLERLDV
jgi:hypothetical protein